MRTLALVVPREEGESVRRRLRELGVLRTDRAIREEGGTLLIPIAEPVDLDYPAREVDLPERTGLPPDYREVADVPEELRPLLPRSFDVVGDVLILKLAEALLPHAEAVAEALRETHPGVATVARDRGVEGEWRTRSLEILAGRPSTRTVHREYGLELAVDPAAVHFSPRMATERRRVAHQVERGEVVVDAFCGVGPFALHAARAGARRVYAVDANPEAVAFLRENVRRNRAEAVEVRAGRVEDVLPTLDPADRVVLDFPYGPGPFVPAAREALRPGGVLHLYEILERAELEERLEALRGRGLEVLTLREVRGYSPSQVHYGFDLRAGPG